MNSRTFPTALAFVLAAIVGLHLRGAPVLPPPPPAAPAPAGEVMADAYADLQDAVDALGERGGVVRLGPRTYQLRRPVQLGRRVAFHGVMDAKAAFAVTKIMPAADFHGEWLFETKARPARTNPDLNADLGFYDLVVVGSPEIGGLHANNCDIVRIERCRFAYLKRCVDVGVTTDLPRPYPAPIVPGGLFITNSIFQASDVCLNLEYATQNRIVSNWFVSNSGVVLRLKNSNKTWFVANEVNSFTRAAVVLEDDGGGNTVHNVIVALNWMHSMRPDTRFIEVIGGDQMHHVVITDNIMEGPAGLQLPPMSAASANRFSGNTGEHVRTENAGTATVAAGQRTAVVRHELFQVPVHVSVTPGGEAPTWWVEAVGPETFTIHFQSPLRTALSVSWRAVVFP